MPREEQYGEYSEQVLPTTRPLEDRIDSRQPGPHVVLGILLFLTGVTLVFGIAKVVQDVRGPFKATEVSSEDQAKLLLGQSSVGQDALKKLDTDGDGISDYDEQNVYSTSPYIKDSDSDGKDDKAEISAGTDPNCPEGEDCFRQEMSGNTGVVPQQVDSSSLSNLGKLSSGEVNSVVNPSVSELRGLLLQSGVSAEQLNQIDDETLISLYKKTIGGGASVEGGSASSANSSSSASVTGSVDLSKLSNPEQLTTSEMRQILLQSGKITQAQLDAVDDTTLREAFLQSARENKQP